MACMIKEKRRGKKKTKEKHTKESELCETSSHIGVTQNEEDSPEIVAFENTFGNTVKHADICPVTEEIVSQNITKDVEQSTSAELHEENEATISKTDTACSLELNAETLQKTFSDVDSYKNLNARLKRIVIPVQSTETDESALAKLEQDVYSQSVKNKILQESHNSPEFAILESIVPSAPVSQEQTEPQAPPEEELIQFEKPKLQCMPLDEAIRLYGGIEIAAVKAMSEREEAEVEAGPHYNPEHPLVDLLSTFRSSIRAVDRERSRLASNFDEEEKHRATLWKVEKKKIHLTEQCKCGLNVDMKATYEYAQLMKEKIPGAKMKLEGLLRDVQESYCHHQHAALLAHCQIEDYVAETIQGSKNGIREALSLILQSLRVSDGAPDALPGALQRWAELLAGALLDERDLRQLFFVMHHLFRQTRSVRWAARVLSTRVTDSVTAARTLAVLDILLSKIHLEAAVECVEETDEAWEEVDIRGGGGAVSSGTLRERDLVSLVRALPLHQLVSKLLLFQQSDFRQASEYDWGDASGGNGLLKSCCGVRVLLSILQRAVTLHSTYERLRGVLRRVACSAMTALACLYRSPRAPYLKELEDKIRAELHATFVAGFKLFGSQELHTLPTTLLTEDAAKDYCLTFIVGLHDKSPKMIESLSIEPPVLPCAVRLRIITHAAAAREQDHELARIVLDFLLQTGLKHKSVPCKAGCEPTARECVPVLLTAHPYLRCLALYTVADLSQVETLDPNTVSVLQVNKWRPNVEEVQAVLHDWSQRCPNLLQQLLLQLDYTPHSGVCLPVQLEIGRWACSWAAGGAARVEGAWRVLLRLRTHRAAWAGPCAAPPPDPAPADPLSAAHAVLATEWGHSLPLICSRGVQAIYTLCATRPREAVHCLAPVMLLMLQSPESISLTPKFAEVFTALVGCAPSLVQRALGRGGASGADLLLRLVLTQLHIKQPYVFPAWLHALWKVPAALYILDIGALAVRDWYTMDHYAASLIQEENAKEHIRNAVRFAGTSPLLSECVLRAAHAREVSSGLFPGALHALGAQRSADLRVHVDNALQKINPNISSEELIIYRCAGAALVAPFQHPSHLALWRLFFHMYLQRPHCQLSIPCGTLFFSGIIKSRTLSQIKKRLLETATYHHNEAELFNKEIDQSNQPTSNRVASESIVIDSSQQLLPPLTITDLTGESRSESDDSDSDEDQASKDVTVDGSTQDALVEEKKRNANMLAYHAGAEKMMRECHRWLEDGEKVLVPPQSADIARYITPQALEEAWQSTLKRCRPPPSPELDTFITPAEPPPRDVDVTSTPLQTAVASILSVKCRSTAKSLRKLKPRVDEIDDSIFGDVRRLLQRVGDLLKDIEKYAQEWEAEVCRISCQDTRLWELVGVLRVPRPLPPVRRPCANNCKPITFHLNTHEWCISAGAEHGIRESRSASLAGIRRLTRASPRVARTAAALHTIARRTRDGEHAVKVLELAWRCAGQLKTCNAAHAALVALFDQLAERWISHDARLCRALLRNASERNASALQHTLCGSLVAPRRLSAADWPDVYITLLDTRLPSHTVFSFLSRFEMSRWAETADPCQRRAVLKALLEAAVRATSREELTEPALVELLGLHMVALTSGGELAWLLLQGARLSAGGGLMPVYWGHFNRAAVMHAGELTYDELGDLLRVLGSVWSAASPELCAQHAAHALHFVEVLCTLVREFTAAAIKLTFEPARVGECAWRAAVCAWSPWLCAPPTSPHHVTMAERFSACLRQLMADCPGSESMVLRHVFAWVVARGGGEWGGSAWGVLRVELARLPWREHQWCTAPVCGTFHLGISSEDDELARWCCERFSATTADTFLTGLEEERMDLGTHLANLLKLFTGNLYVNDPEILKQAALLPWWHLTEHGFIEGLEMFFGVRYNPSQPYHETPHIDVVLHAAELQPHAQYSPWARRKRSRVAARGAASCSAPAHAHAAPALTRYMLHRITAMNPYLEADETQDLLYSVALIMTWKQSDICTAVQTVWSNWICNAAPAHMLPACAEMSSRLTVLEVTAPVVEDATRMYILKCEGGWGEMRRMWQSVLQPWSYVERRALHAAYAGELTHAPAHAHQLFTTFLTLTEGNGIDFIESETIIAVWICYITRAVLECNIALAQKQNSTPTPPSATAATNATRSDIAATTATPENRTKTCLEECKHAALSLLATWGQQQRRSILKVVTLQADTGRPTARHRALIRLADCIISPSGETAQAYECACAALSGAGGDVTAWGHAPSPDRLPRLATRLFPTAPGRYFQYEINQVSSE